jgi:hypothetical protein
MTMLVQPRGHMGRSGTSTRRAGALLPPAVVPVRIVGVGLAPAWEGGVPGAGASWSSIDFPRRRR